MMTKTLSIAGNSQNMTVY